MAERRRQGERDGERDAEGRRGKQEVTGCGRIINNKKAAMKEDDLEQCKISI